MPRDRGPFALAGAQLLVVRSRGRGGLAGMSLGSVAQAVMHHAPYPVAVIGSAEEEAGKSHPKA
jgi:nucleotide-binding universal stress UspA family protein